jgi:serine O-acetyltransferase
LIGAGTQILRNITVGDQAKIGAGSVILCPISSGTRAMGALVKIIGFTARGKLPDSTINMNLEGVKPFWGDKIHANRLLK